MTTETMLCVQTTTQVVLTLATVGTLIVLIGYARDTKIIAKNSNEQVENSLIPFVALIEKEAGRGYSSNWAIKNLGKGPALNIRYSRCGVDDKLEMQMIMPLAPGEPYDAIANADENFTTKSGFTVEYQSLSGKKYRTTVRRVNGERQHVFEKIT
jgi:hypothetical protein